MDFSHYVLRHATDIYNMVKAVKQMKFVRLHLSFLYFCLFSEVYIT